MYEVQANLVTMKIRKSKFFSLNSGTSSLEVEYALEGLICEDTIDSTGYHGRMSPMKACQVMTESINLCMYARMRGWSCT